MILQTVIGSNGPLPVQGNFGAESDLETVMFVSGSVWSNQAGQWVGVQILLDGNVVGEGVVYCNEASSHRAFIPVMIPVTVPFGAHTVTLSAVNNNTMADVNDYFNVYLLY